MVSANIEWIRSSIFWNLSHLQFSEKLRSSSISWKVEVIFHFLKNWGLLPFSEKLRSSSISWSWGRLPSPEKIGVIFVFLKNWGCLPFLENLRSSSISWKIDIVFHFVRSDLDSVKLFNQLLESQFCCIKLYWNYASSISWKIEVVFHCLTN